MKVATERRHAQISIRWSLQTMPRLLILESKIQFNDAYDRRGYHKLTKFMISRMNRIMKLACDKRTYNCSITIRKINNNYKTSNSIYHHHLNLQQIMIHLFLIIQSESVNLVRPSSCPGQIWHERSCS